MEEWEGTSPVPKEQVRRLKKRYPCINIIIIPEPWHGKAALCSVQHEHKASQLYFYLFLVELSPLTAKPVWLWIQECFLIFDSFPLLVTNSQYYFHKHWVTGDICSFLICKVAFRDSFSLLTGWGRRGRTVQEILTSLLFPKQWKSCACLHILSMC